MGGTSNFNTFEEPASFSVHETVENYHSCTTRRGCVGNRACDHWGVRHSDVVFTIHVSPVPLILRKFLIPPSGLKIQLIDLLK